MAFLPRLIFVVVTSAMALVFAYRARRSEPAARDTRRAIAVAVVGCGFWSLFFYGFEGEDLSRSALLLAAVILVALAWISCRRIWAGRVLLDLGRSRGHTLHLVIGCFLVALAVVPLVVRLFGFPGFEDISLPLLFFVIAAVFLVSGFNHFEVRERGIFYLDGFVRWARVDSYAWGGDDNLMLTFEMLGPLSFLRHRRVPIPETHKDAVQNLLVEKLPARLEQAAGGFR